MKQLLAGALAAFLITSALYADALPKPFEEMTLEELRAVHTDALTKEQKNHYKKILKAAKKAEEARLKAEKKAEEARLKAERKRRKEEEKRHKETLKRLSFIEASYDKIEVWESHHPTVTNIKGRQAWMGDWSIKEALANTGGELGYFLHSYFQPATGLIEPQLHVTIKFTNTVTQKELNQPYVTPTAYAWEHGLWKSYQFASAPNGAPRMVREGRKHAPNCSYYCTFYEEMDIDLHMVDIEAAVRRGQALKILIASKEAKPLEVIVSYDYLAGYLLRLHAISPLPEDMTQPLENHIAALKSAAATNITAN